MWCVPILPGEDDLPRVHGAQREPRLVRRLDRAPELEHVRPQRALRDALLRAVAVAVFAALAPMTVAMAMIMPMRAVRPAPARREGGDWGEHVA